MPDLPEHSAELESGFGSGGIEVLSADDLLGVGRGDDILVVDDSATNRTAYEAALAPLGRNVVSVGSGVEALSKLLEQEFALTLLDVEMPGMTGIETARMIRERPRSKATPIIFITGVAWRDEVIMEAYALGAFDFVSKPILPEILRAKARLYLQLQERTRQLQRRASELRQARLELEHQRTALRDAQELVAREKLENERTHRADLATAHRLEKLQEATAALAETRTPAQVAEVAARLGAQAVAATASVMWLATTDGSLAIEGSHGIPADYLERWRTIQPSSGLPAARVFARAQPIWVETAADFAREAPDVYEIARAAERVRAYAALPLCRDERVVGVLSFSYEGEHTFSTEERRFLGALVRACQQALERTQLFVAEAEARRRAEAASLRKDELLAMLGHELRNPLASMVSALDLIKLRGQHGSQEIAVLERQVGHLSRIVGDLVDVSRVTQGKITLRRTVVVLLEVVRDGLELARPRIERQQHRVSVGVSPELLVDADRERLAQVFGNLLDNAATYTPEHGHIDVSAEAAGGFVTVRVRDNGIGVAPDLVPQLFDIFVQGPRAVDRSEGGLGVGLSIVRAIVELHGGTTDVHSDGPGCGSTFTVRLPRAPSRAATEVPPAIVRTGTRPLRVLIVDDNSDAGEMLELIVRALGHEPRFAHSAGAALETAKTFRPHVALLDIGLPDMSGYDLARQLRVMPTCESTVLIAVTGYGQPEDQARSMEAGFARHIVKPIELKMLEALLATMPVDDAGE